MMICSTPTISSGVDAANSFMSCSSTCFLLSFTGLVGCSTTCKPSRCSAAVLPAARLRAAVAPFLLAIVPNSFPHNVERKEQGYHETDFCQSESSGEDQKLFTCPRVGPKLTKPVS